MQSGLARGQRSSVSFDDVMHVQVYLSNAAQIQNNEAQPSIIALLCKSFCALVCASFRIFRVFRCSIKSAWPVRSSNLFGWFG